MEWLSVLVTGKTEDPGDKNFVRSVGVISKYDYFQLEAFNTMLSGSSPSLLNVTFAFSAREQVQ